jgi:hypothetical protein
MLPEDITIDQITHLSEKYNQQYPDIIFLPDHKDRKTFINGVQTNNGKHNLLLCQLRSRLKIARDKLKKAEKTRASIANINNSLHLPPF